MPCQAAQEQDLMSSAGWMPEAKLGVYHRCAQDPESCHQRIPTAAKNPKTHTVFTTPILRYIANLPRMNGFAMVILCAERTCVPSQPLSAQGTGHHVSRASRPLSEALPLQMCAIWESKCFFQFKVIKRLGIKKSQRGSGCQVLQASKSLPTAGYC